MLFAIGGVDVEDEIRQLWQRHEYAAAVTCALDAYGGEVMGYLAACAADRTTAVEAFSCFSEKLWLGAPSFRWQSSFRTWMYIIARNAFRDVIRSDQVRARRHLVLDDVPDVLLAIRGATTRTPYQRTTLLDHVQRLRAQLDPADRELLILRIDRQLSWIDIVEILDPGGAATDAARRAAALRKRFERVKERLRRKFDALRPTP